MKKNVLYAVKGIAVVLIIVAFVVIIRNVVSGTANSKTEGNTMTLAEKLYEKKNAYVGDASADSALVQLLHSIGDVTESGMELQTEKEPYRLTLYYTENRMDSIADSDEMLKNAILLFATIDNLGEVEYQIYQADSEDVNTGKINFKTRYTREQIDELLGKEVRDYGKSAKKMQTLIETIEKTKASDLK